MTRKFHFFVLALLALGILIPLLLLKAKELKQDAPPILGQISEFALVDSDGQAFTQKNMSGKIWVADFIFTTCAGPCPVMTEKMSDLIGAIPSAPDLHFVSVSVNPDYDTPEVLKKYGEKHNADFSRWHFLTGPAEEIHRTAALEFKLGSVENPVFHSDRFVLVDACLRIRGYYDVQDPQGFEKLKNDIQWLLETPEICQSLISLL